MTISQIWKLKAKQHFCATSKTSITSKTSKKNDNCNAKLQSWRLSSQKTKLDIDKRFKQLQKIQLLLNTQPKQAKQAKKLTIWVVKTKFWKFKKTTFYHVMLLQQAAATVT